MKRIIISLLILIGSLIPMGIAHATASYCGTSAYDLHYRSIFEYPTGSYWVNQINHYPSYYAAHNSFYLSKYGC